MSLDPPRRLPPLNALRAFEVAARHGGFTAAAREIGVTPGAVAQQVKKLEDWLGHPLFDRVASGVSLTPRGALLAEDLAGAFDAITETMRRAQGRAPRQRVSIAALPSIAQLWLGPRLGALRRQFPGLAMEVTAMETPPDPRRDLHDLAIFVLEGETEPPGYTATTLEPDAMLPVCAPALAAGLGTPAALAQAPLLHDSSWDADWPRWLAAQALTRGRGGDDSRFSLYAMAIEAAVAGEGVLIGHLPLVRRHLEDGRLVCPFPGTALVGGRLALLRPRREAAAAVDSVVAAILASV